MDNRIILDGAMGTMLQSMGMKTGDIPEIFGMQNPEIVSEIYSKYIEAGSNVTYANTFGANRFKLARSGFNVEKVIAENIEIAKKTSNGRSKVALDVGPIGALMEPLGTLTFDEAYDIFKEMVVAGEKAGADLVIFETMTDLYEVKAAVLAAQENSSLPIWVTMSFEANGRTFTGTTVSSMAQTLDALNIDAMGINCSLGPIEIYPLIKEMKEWTAKPIIVKPNAGLPDPATGKYAINAEEFASQMEVFSEIDVNIMGGCCGTSPEFIKALSNMHVRNCTYEGKAIRRGICSASHMSELNRINVVGERINPTGKKRFQQALLECDLDYIMGKAIEQVDAGADILDINVGMPGIDEPEMMEKVVKAVQSVVSVPLQIDSTNPEAIERGLRYCNGRAIVNSVNGEDEKLEQILPIVKRYGAAVIGLALDSKGIPEDADGRIAIAEKILKAAEKYGIKKEDVIIDCLTLTISAQQEQAKYTLEAVRRVKNDMGLHCTLGVSNISFGLPERTHVTESFLTQAMYCGLDLPIINPNQKGIMDAVFSFRALSGEDESCSKYIERFAAQDEATEKQTALNNNSMDIQTAILKGLKKETRELTGKLLENMSELEVINSKLIPALDVVGDKYEKQEIFLPQLINSANAACEGFELIKTRIAEKGGQSVSKGKIILATVAGDIHDIGKNIVKVVLENYGFQVLDLGKDVPVETVVKTAIEEDVKLVGLSALMTTTLESMKNTIRALHESGHKCSTIVGGAVLTEEYAKEIGADYYAKDAKASADIAKQFFGIN